MKCQISICDPKSKTSKFTKKKKKNNMNIQISDYCFVPLEITCRPLPLVKDGKIFPSACTKGDVPFGTTCQISCYHGYSAMGPPTKQCTPDGLWTPSSEGEMTHCEGMVIKRVLSTFVVLRWFFCIGRNWLYLQTKVHLVESISKDKKIIIRFGQK